MFEKKDDAEVQAFSDNVITELTQEGNEGEVGVVAQIFNPMIFKDVDPRLAGGVMESKAISISGGSPSAVNNSDHATFGSIEVESIKIPIIRVKKIVSTDKGEMERLMLANEWVQARGIAGRQLIRQILQVWDNAVIGGSNSHWAMKDNNQNEIPNKNGLFSADQLGTFKINSGDPVSIKTHEDAVAFLNSLIDNVGDPMSPPDTIVLDAQVYRKMSGLRHSSGLSALDVIRESGITVFPVSRFNYGGMAFRSTTDKHRIVRAGMPAITEELIYRSIDGSQVHQIVSEASMGGNLFLDKNVYAVGTVAK